jgi:hypothetical protein
MTPKIRIVRVVATLLIAAVMATAVVLGSRGRGLQFSPAHFFQARPQVTIHRDGKVFSGRIKSRRPRCKANRRVTLVKSRRGISDKIVGRTRTGPRGRWRIRRPRPRGRFYAVIPRKQGSGYGHRHLCRKDRSRRTKRARG